MCVLKCSVARVFWRHIYAHTHLRACVCKIRHSGRGRAIPTSRESHKTYVLFSTPCLSLPTRWLLYADVYNLVTWCHIKGPLAHFFNKHFLHFWKQLVTSEERSTRASRLTKCVQQQKFERRAGT